MTEGKIVQNYIRNNCGGIEAFAKKIGKDRSFLYYNLKGSLSDEMKAILKKAGVNVTKVLGAVETIEEGRKGMTEIPVVINARRRAFIQLPALYNDADIDTVLKVLKAYKKQ